MQAVNYDEAMVPEYRLPEIMTMVSGQRVTQGNWAKRREELIELFRTNIYGESPDSGWVLEAKIDREDLDAYGGLVIRQETLITVKGPRGGLSFRALVHLPAGPIKAGQRVPALMGLNFSGNHTTNPDEWITVSDAWSANREAEDYSFEDREHCRGCLSARWPVLRAIAAGYAVITVFSAEIDEDRDDGFSGGVHGVFESPDQRTDTSWGTIAAWSWGLSRTLDALISVEPRVDHDCVGLLGHSRMGKAALWAAATDQRFAWVISNNSGCTGAAISRRCFGERLLDINTRFPHWFCRAYHDFNDKEHALPVDQHQLLALIAPRPLYVCSARLDKWADPLGEFTSCVKASPAYELLGYAGLTELSVYPTLNTSIGDHIGYHCRPGKHDITETDWQHFLGFLKRHQLKPV